MKKSAEHCWEWRTSVPRNQPWRGRNPAQVDDRDLIIAAAEEYFPTALDSLGSEGLPLLERSNEAGETQRWSAKAVLRTAESAFCIDAFDHVRTLVDSRLKQDHLDEAVRYELTRMLDWLPGGKHLEPLPTTAGKRNFGVLSYDQPGIRSRNVGDYIQTIASIGHLLRYENLSFTGDAGLTELFAKFRSSVKDERKYAGPRPNSTSSRSIVTAMSIRRFQKTPGTSPSGGTCTISSGSHSTLPLHPNPASDPAVGLRSLSRNAHRRGHRLSEEVRTGRMP